MTARQTMLMTTAAAFVMLSAGGAWAQTTSTQQAVAADQSTQLEEVVVMARKQSENLQKTPVAVTAVTASELVNANIDTITDIQTKTPGLQSAPAPNNALSPLVSIRGVLSNEIAPNFDPSVGIYVDGVYVGTTIGAILNNYVDVDRIEVLKGPQGTLYGRNTTGGALNIYTKQPTDHFEGELVAGYGNYNRREFDGTINIPLATDRAALRLVGSYLKDDGYGYDTGNNRRLADQEVSMLRGTLHLQVTDDTDVTLRADWQKGETGGFIAHAELLRPGSAANTELAFRLFGPAGFTPAGMQGALDYWNAAAAGDRFTTSYNHPTSADSKVWGTSGTISHSIGLVTLKSITAYRETETNSVFEFSPLASADYSQQYTKVKQFTEELQLNGATENGRFKYVGGLFYYKQDSDDLAKHHVLPALGGPNLDFTAIGTAKSWAGYGQGTFSITDSLRLTGGLRYTKEDKELAVSNLSGTACTLPPSLVTGPVCVLDRSVSFDAVSYTASLDWSPTEAMLLYARTSKGFKSGGLPQRIQADPQTAEPFAPETVIDYEVGVKSQWLDNRLRINAAAYHSDYTDIQRSVLVPGFMGGPPATATQNAAQATINGLELETQLLATEHLLLSATAAVVDAKYQKFISGGVDVSGQKFQNQPKYTYSLTGAYTFPLSFGDLRAQLDWYWRSSADMFPAGSAPASARVQPGFGLLNGRLALNVPDKGLQIAVWGKNLADQEYITTVFDLYSSLGTTVAVPGAPRTFGVEIRKSF